MGRKQIDVWEDENGSYTEEDLVRANARLEKVLKPLQENPESDSVLYHSIEEVVLGSEPSDVKESMVICMLEMLFLRFASKFSN